MAGLLNRKIDQVLRNQLAIMDNMETAIPYQRREMDEAIKKTQAILERKR